MSEKKQTVWVLRAGGVEVFQSERDALEQAIRCVSVDIETQPEWRSGRPRQLLELLVSQHHYPLALWFFNQHCGERRHISVDEVEIR